MVVTEHLYLRYPDRAEGALAPMRAAVVNAVALADIAVELDLGPWIRLGKGEEGAGGREKGSILSDAVEAVIGAVYLDGGWAPARDLVVGLVAPRLDALDASPGQQDHKTHLQELAARTGSSAPVYEVDSSGPDHARSFRASVRLDGALRGTGEGRSKKQAEQAAAAAAIAALAGEADAPIPDTTRRHDDQGVGSTDA